MAKEGCANMLARAVVKGLRIIIPQTISELTGTTAIQFTEIPKSISGIVFSKLLAMPRSIFSMSR